MKRTHYNTVLVVMRCEEVLCVEHNDIDCWPRQCQLTVTFLLYIYCRLYCMYAACGWFSMYVVLCMALYLQCVQKSEPPNILHWRVQTCPVLKKIKRAVTQKDLSYCHKISYDFIISLNRFLIVTNCCDRFQLPTWLAYYVWCT